jgi:predicted enzyme related to lactoylglutathione lyase
MGLGPVGQIHMSVTDVERSVAFYRDVLGIPHLFTVPTSPEYTSRCVLYFRVDDIDGEVTRLSELGVGFRDRPRVVHRDGTTELWMAGLTDPDGHHIILMQERTAAA